MRLGILPLPVLLSLFGILQLPSRWGQGKQFYCRRVYEPELRLGGESVVYRIWGPPRKGPARVCTAPRPAAQSSPAARPGGLFLRFLYTPPHPVEIPLPERLPAPDPPRTRPGWGVGAQEEGHSRLGPSAGAGPRLGAQIGSRAGAQAAAEPSAAGGGTATARLAMSSGSEPRTPRTPFSIADILGPHMVPRGPSASQLPKSNQGPTSPLCALEELTSKTFRVLDGHAPQPSEGIAPARSLTVTWPTPHFFPPGSRSRTFVHPGRHPNPHPALSPRAGACLSLFSPPLR